MQSGSDGSAGGGQRLSDERTNFGVAVGVDAGATYGDERPSAGSSLALHGCVAWVHADDPFAGAVQGSAGVAVSGVGVCSE